MNSFLSWIPDSSVLQQYAGTVATILAGIALVQLVRSGGNTQPDQPTMLPRQRFIRRPPVVNQAPEEEEVVEVDNTFKPKPIDVIVVKVMLEKAACLPPELLNIIFDQAEYWPHSHVEINYSTPLRISGTHQEENKFLLRSPPIGFTSTVGATKSTYQNTPSSPLPLENEQQRAFFEKLLKNTETPTLVHPVRKIVFNIKSNDQGWGGERGDQGTFRGSWTWFEAGLERFDAGHTCKPDCAADGRVPQATDSTAPQLPVCALRSIRPDVDANSEGHRWFKQELPADDQWKIQGNKTATRKAGKYRIVWSWTDDIDPESPEAVQLSEQGRGKGTANGDFVRSLKMGDVVTVWGMARFGGWVNIVSGVSIDIYWAV